jgi:ABC-type branched-subunit amino acid transport system substrate-binding protein
MRACFFPSTTFLLLLSFSGASWAGPLIGYGSADAVLPAKTQETFYLGFELGLSVTTKREDINQLLAVENSWDGSPLGAQRSAKKLVKRGIIALAGYPISSDALLASKVTLKAGIMALFSAARHSDLDKLGKLVVSAVPSMSFDVESFMKLIADKYPGKQGLLISNPYNAFCQNQEDLFAQFLKEKRFNKIKATSMHLNRDMKLSEADLKRIEEGRFSYLFMTTYPDTSLRVLGQLDALGLDIPIIANASWTTDDFELIRRVIIRHKAPVYSVALWYPGNEAGQKFEREIRKKYGREPSSEAAYGYDLGVIVGTTLNRIQGPATPESFVKAFYQKPCFEGTTTSGTVCFAQTGGHSTRQLTFVRFSQGGFSPIKALPVSPR